MERDSRGWEIGVCQPADLTITSTRYFDSGIQHFEGMIVATNHFPPKLEALQKPEGRLPEKFCRCSSRHPSTWAVTSPRHPSQCWELHRISLHFTLFQIFDDNFLLPTSSLVTWECGVWRWNGDWTPDWEVEGCAGDRVSKRCLSFAGITLPGLARPGLVWAR